MITHYPKNISLILFLIPISFVAGIAVTEILAFLSLVILILYNRNKLVFFDPKIVFLFIFSIYIFFNAYLQIFDDLRLSSFFHIRFVIFSISIFSCVKFMKTTKIKIFYILFFLYLSYHLMQFSVFKWFKFFWFGV